MPDSKSIVRKKRPRVSQNCPNGAELPNLVTLIAVFFTFSKPETVWKLRSHNFRKKIRYFFAGLKRFRFDQFEKLFRKKP